MRIIITGATGFIGKKLGLRLVQEGHELIVLARSAQRAQESLPFPCQAYTWDPVKEERNHILKDLIKECDAVIHLAGESVADGRWSKQRKQEILDSRIKSTRSLHDLIQQLPGRKPKVFIAASAVGFYGSRGEEELTESHAAGEGFLAEVCKQWEREIFSHRLSETRVVALRVGMVLGRDGGALAKLIPLFKMGGGSSLGKGDQWMSWIHWQDLVRLMLFLLNGKGEGVFNAVAPQPVRNRDFTKVLCARLGVWQFPAVPAGVLRLVLGQMSEMVLGSQRVVCPKTLAAGFTFTYESFDSAIYQITGDVELERGTFAQEFVAEQFVPKKPEEIWPFFSDALNLEKITPPFLEFQVLDQSTPKVAEGTLIDYRLKLHGVPIRWKTRIQDWKPIEKFVDMQLKGPYSLWHHTHTFIPLAKGTLIVDRVLYRLPLGFLGHAVAGRFVRGDVESIFSYRKSIIRKTF